MPSNILITDGTTPLGIATARLFLNKGHHVTLFGSDTAVPKEIKEKVRVIKGAITNEATVLNAVKGHELVLHLTETTELQHSKKHLHHINVTGTELLLRASQTHQVKRVVFLSSASVYGKPHELPLTEKSALNPLDTYSRSKVLAERVCKTYQDQGTAVTILRPMPILGPSNIGPFTIWFEALFQGRRLFILGNGKNKYQLLSLSDLAAALYHAAFSQTTNTIYNLGAAEYTSLRRDLQSLIRFDRASSSITSLPPSPLVPLLTLLQRVHASPFAKRYVVLLSQPYYTSISKAEKELAWTPQKSNKELLLEGYLWYKKNRKKILKRQDRMQHAAWHFSLYELLSRF